jgi:hypothetical protein
MAGRRPDLIRSGNNASRMILAAGQGARRLGSEQRKIRREKASTGTSSDGLCTN